MGGLGVSGRKRILSMPESTGESERKLKIYAAELVEQKKKMVAVYEKGTYRGN